MKLLIVESIRKSIIIILLMELWKVIACGFVFPYNIYMQLIFASFDEKISPLPYIYILLMNGVMKHSWYNLDTIIGNRRMDYSNYKQNFERNLR